MPELPQDIIFQIMLSALGSNALDILRRLSQISQTWRALALSPTLWAKALDFEDLRLKKDIWKTEVLRRTGNCALHVSGSWIPSVTQEFFLHEFLVPNMHRVKTLHAHIGLMTNKVAMDPAWTVIFDQPAPVLEIFGLDFNTRHRQDPPRAIRHALRDGKALFSGHVPALHTFNNHPYLIVNPGTQPVPDWIVNLTTLMLSEDPKTVLTILTRTPRLRRLFLMDTEWEEIEGLVEVSSIDLPYLEYIYKHGNYPDSSFAEIQKAIQVPPGISIFVTCRTKECIPGITTIFREYIERTKPRKLLLRLSTFWFCDFSLDSRTAAVDDIFQDSSRKDFAIRIRGEWVEPADFLELVMQEEVDFSSVHEWHIRRRACSSYSDCSKETNAALKDFFAKVLLPDQALIVDKRNYKRLGRYEVLPKDHPVEVVENGPHDDDRRIWGGLE